MPTAWKSVCSTLLLLCGNLLAANAQVYKPTVFSVLYEGNAADHNFQTVETAQNDMVSAGSALLVDGGFSQDARAYRLSLRGTLL